MIRFQAAFDVGEFMIVISKPSTFAHEVADFQAARAALLVNDEQPIKLQSGAKIMLHLIPCRAFEANHVNLDFFERRLRPLGNMAGQASRNFSFDGFVECVPSSGDAGSYVLAFHNGIIEAVSVGFAHIHSGKNYIAIGALEDSLIERASEYCQIQQAVGISTPVAVCLALLGVREYGFVVYDPNPRSEGVEIDRDNLLVPAVEVNSFDADFATVLRPIFNRLWNAAGFSRSKNYDEEGRRINR
jgi:hypothetical protein